MPQPIEIDFVAGGIASVLKAFDSLDAKAEQVERSVSGRVASGSRTRESTTKREVDTREKEYQKLLREIEAQEKAATKAAAKEAAARTKATASAEKASTREAERESKLRQKLAVAEERAWAKSLSDGLRERERAAKAATRIEEQAAAERTRITEREAAHSRAYGRSMGRVAAGSLGRTLSGGASMLGGALTVGGGFAVAGALREDLKFGEAVAQTSNAAFVEGDPRRTRAAADPAKIAALATSVQAGTNIGKTDVVQALHKYVNLASDLTGMSAINSETGRSNLEEMARLAKGSGANYEDLMTSAGYLMAQNPNMAPKELNLRMRQMVGAGQKGDIALADMAKYSELATANAGQFGGDLGANQAKMLGLAQIAGRVADPAEAAEAVNKLAIDVSKNATKMRAAGVAVTDKSGKLLDPAEIIGSLFEKTGGNVGKLSAMGIDVRSMRVLQGEQRTYDEAEAVKKGSGSTAVRREVRDFENISFSQQSADENFANVMNTDTEKLSKAMNELEESVAHAALPAFEEFVKMLNEHKGDIEEIVKGLGSLASALVEHPIGGILAAIAANVGKDVASAAIGKLIESKVAALLNAGGGGGGVPGVAAGGAAGAAVGILGAAALTADMLISVGGAASSGEKQGKENVNRLLGDLKTAEAGVKAGTTTPEEAEKVRNKVRAALSKARDDTGVAGNTLDLASVPLATGFAGFIAPETAAQARKDIANVHAQDEVVKGQAALTRAMESLERTMRNQGGVPGAPAGGASRAAPTIPGGHGR